MRAISKNWNLFIIAFIYGTVIAAMNTAATAGGEIAPYFDFTPKQASYFGISLILGGLIGSVINGIILTRTKKFKLLIVSCAAVSLICRSLMAYGYTLNKSWLMILLSFLSGIFTLPLIPTCYEMGVEVTHPLDETFSAAVVTLAEVVMSIILNTTCSHLISEYKKDGCFDTLYILIGV